MTTDREHDFVLVLSGVSDLTDEVADALFAAGCDDATPSLRFGRVYLTFTRSAPSLKAAVLSAIKQVRSAGLGADVVRVDHCNLVTQAEIARKIGRTRQLVGQYVSGGRGPGGFPAPVCGIGDHAPLWYWCEVAYWLRQHDMIAEKEFQDAQAVAAINSLLDQHQLRASGALTDDLLAAVA